MNGVNVGDDDDDDDDDDNDDDDDDGDGNDDDDFNLMTSDHANNIAISVAGRQDDDRRRRHLCRLLVSPTRLLPHHEPTPGVDDYSSGATHLPGCLLAGHEQLDVQPHHILLDEQ